MIKQKKGRESIKISCAAKLEERGKGVESGIPRNT